MTCYAISQGIISNLSAASALGSRGISKDYSILEQTQNVAAVLSWMGLRDVSATFGDPTGKDVLWTFRLEVYIKDTGSASAMMDSAMTSVDTILASLNSDDTLQGTGTQVTECRASRTPGTGVRIGDVNFLPYNLDVDVLEFL